MPDEKKVEVDKALAAQGAGAGDTNDSENLQGNPVPEVQAKAPKADPEKSEADDKADDKADDAKAADPDDKAEADDADKPGDEEKKPFDKDVWGETGDETGDHVLSLLHDAGMEPADAKALMYDAVRAGDVSKIDVKALAEKVGERNANLIMAGTRDFVSRSTAKAEAIVKEVQSAVGGEDNWTQVTTWAKDNVPETDMAEYRTMIDNGGAQARFAATELASRFNSDEGNTSLNTNTALTPDTASTTTGRALTKAAYYTEVEAAYKRGASEAEIGEIKAARARGRSKGI